MWYPLTKADATFLLKSIIMPKVDRLGRFIKGFHYHPSTEFKKGSQVNKGRKRPDVVLRNKANRGSNWKGGISIGENYARYSSWYCKRRRVKRLGNGGIHTLGEWENLKAQYNFTCPACGKKEPFDSKKSKELTEDHIIPISKGGSDNIVNIQPLCFSCNVKKHNKIIKYEVI